MHVTSVRPDGSDLRDGVGGDEGGGPCCLEVESSGDGVDVEHLAGEEETRYGLRLEGAVVDGVEAHAASGNELLLVLPAS